MIKTLTLLQKGNNHYIDSREVAELVGKQHKHLLTDIRRYSEIIRKKGQPKIRPSDFFVESSYINLQNKEMPCYLLSKMGCECIAHKLSGEKGVLFTVSYISTYNEMETNLHREQDIQTSSNKLNLVEGNKFGNIPKTYSAQQLAQMVGMYSLYGNPHATAISCLLNEKIFISNKHKYAVSNNCENGTINTFRYGEYAIELIHDWLNVFDYPNEINGLYRTYHVIYREAEKEIVFE